MKNKNQEILPCPKSSREDCRDSNQYPSSPTTKARLRHLDRAYFTIDHFGAYTSLGTFYDLAELCRKKNKNTMICEFIRKSCPINLFFDIDGKGGSIDLVLSNLVNRINSIWSEFERKFILLTSHGAEAPSAHLIVRLTRDDVAYVFKSLDDLKLHMISADYQNLSTNEIKIDLKVYREGLFRAIYTDKIENKTRQNRPFAPDYSLGEFEDVESFVQFVHKPTMCYITPDMYSLDAECATPVAKRRRLSKVTTISEQYKREIHKELTVLLFHDDYKKIVSTKLDDDILFIDIDSKCPFTRRRHRSNHAYLVIQNDTWQLKCHDENCSKKTLVIKAKDEVPARLSATPIPAVFKNGITGLNRTVYNMLARINPYTIYRWLSESVECDLKCYGKSIYRFESGIWVEYTKNSFIGVLTETLLKELVKLENLLNQLPDYKDCIITRDDAKKTQVNVLEAYKALRSKIENVKIVEQIVNLILGINLDREFALKLDTNWDILPFKNGAFDLVSQSFRPLKKEDYVTRVIPYDYNNTIHINDVDVFLEQVLPNVEVREFTLALIVKALRRVNKNEFLILMLGDGANGKSMFVSFLQACFPGIVTSANPSIFNPQNASSSKARPDLMHISNARLAIVSELCSNALDCNAIKALTGSDRISAREIYDKEQDINLDTSFIICSNQMPTLYNYDSAFARRLYLCKFCSKFVDSPQRPGEFKRDRLLREKLINNEKAKQTMVNILLADANINRDISKIPQTLQLKNQAIHNQYLEFEIWLQNRIVYNPNAILYTKEVIDTFAEAELNVNGAEYKKYYKRLLNWLNKQLPENKTFETGSFYSKKIKRQVRGIKGFLYKEILDLEKNQDALTSRSEL